MQIHGILIMLARKIFKKMHAFSNIRNIKVNLTSSFFSTDTFDWPSSVKNQEGE